MAGERIDNLTDVRHLAREYGKEPQGSSAMVAGAAAGPAQPFTVTGTDMPGGVEADLNELRAAERELARLHEGLMEHLRAANALTEPMTDGSSPVAKHMRKAFFDRADIEGGVQAALVDYMEELMAVRAGILDAVADYEGVDSAAAEQLKRQSAELGREAP